MMVPTKYNELDKLVECYSGCTLIYGEGGSGKTTICLLASLERAIKNKKVLFLDTEANFSAERFQQLSKNKDCIKNIRGYGYKLINHT